MTQEQKNHIQQLAKEHFRYSFSHIKAKADSKGAHLEAYYLFLVDDFFALVMQLSVGKLSRLMTPMLL